MIEVLKDGPAVRSTISSLDTSSGVFTPITTGDLNDNDPRFGPGGEIAFARNTSDPAGIVRVGFHGSTSRTALAATPQASRRLVGGLGRQRRGSLVFRSSADGDAWELPPGSKERRRLTQAKEPIEQVQLSRTRAGSHALAPPSRVDRKHACLQFQRPAGAGRSPTRAAFSRCGARTAVRVTTLVSTPLSMPSKFESRVRNSRLAPRNCSRTLLPVMTAVVEQYRVSPDGGRFFCSARR